MTPSSDLAGWTPIHVEMGQGKPKVEWCRLGGVRFSDPFFEQTIARGLRNPARLLFQRETSIDVLESIEDVIDGLRPSGFIFHMSRCGSTLVAQMLAALPHSIVISEAPPIDQVLSSHLRLEVTAEKRITWLRGLVVALTQRHSAQEQHSFIKFDSWHILELPLIRTAFPDVPWIFLYRDPVEVMVSQTKLRGMQMIPGRVDPRIFGLDSAAALQLPIDVYGAQVLARICDAGLHYAASHGGRVVNFSQLPGALIDTIGQLFGLTFTNEDLTRLRTAADANAKNPVLPHQADVAKKQREATPALRQLVSGMLGDRYAALEALRATQEKSAGTSANRASLVPSSLGNAGVLRVREQQFA